MVVECCREPPPKFALSWVEILYRYLIASIAMMDMITGYLQVCKVCCIDESRRPMRCEKLLFVARRARLRASFLFVGGLLARTRSAKECIELLRSQASRQWIRSQHRKERIRKSSRRKSL